MLVGGGAACCGALRAALGIAEHCHFLGHRRDVAAILARARIAVSPSHAEGSRTRSWRRWPRGCPSSRPRSEARRRSSATARTASSSLRARPRRAPRLLELLDDAPLCARMGARGRRIVEREFSVEQMRASYDALYEDRTGLDLPALVHGVEPRGAHLS